MGNSIIRVLSAGCILLVLSSVLLLVPTSAESGEEVLSVSIARRTESAWEGTITVNASTMQKMRRDTDVILSFANDRMVSGFRFATILEKEIPCVKESRLIRCHINAYDAELYGKSMQYHFTWQPHDIIEETYCQNVTMKKQNTTNAWTHRLTATSPDGFSYLRRVQVHAPAAVTSDSLRDVVADLSTQQGHVVLWNANTLTPHAITSLRFADGKKSLLGLSDSAYADIYAPRYGTLAALRAGQSASQGYRFFMTHLHRAPITVRDVDLLFCRDERIEDHVIMTPVTHTLTTESGEEVADTSSSEIVVTWDALQYGTQITSTVAPTDPVTREATAPTSTPSPTPYVLVQTSVSASSTPSPTATAKSEETPTPTSRENSPSAVLGAEARAQSSPVARSTPRATVTPSGSVLSADDASRNGTVREPQNGMWWYAGLSVGVGLICGLGWILHRRRRVVASIVLMSIFFMSAPHGVYAQSSPTATKIVDAFTMSGMGGYRSIVFSTELYATKSSAPGRYVISRNPDGTGDIQIGNYLYVLLNWPGNLVEKTKWISTPVTSSTNYYCPATWTLPPQDVTSWFTQQTTYRMKFRFMTSCSRSFPVSDMYLVFIPAPPPTPTPIQPFLDLPWDYRSKGLSFTEAALRMTSYFDHEYPTLSVNGLFDPLDDYVVNFAGNKKQISYSSHDGYDYANASSAYFDDPQLAAGDGIATYHRDYWQMGNAIFIDHQNGYQTRYYHLTDRDLIVDRSDVSVPVHQGERIGRIGFSGNVDPEGEGGAHIHFMLIYDKNHDGKFDDNIPDGLVDPYGWEGGESLDPWETFSFSYAGQNRTGMKSRYLWKHPLVQASQKIASTGGEIRTDKAAVIAPSDPQRPDKLELLIKARPQFSGESALQSVGSTVEITATTEAGAPVTTFAVPIKVELSYTVDDLIPYNLSTLSIYSSSDGKTWQKEPTVIDLQHMIATIYTHHFTHFALMAERADVTPPSLALRLMGTGRVTQFHTPVTLDIDVHDDAGSASIDYTLYQIDDADWQEYLAPVQIASEGAHMVRAFAADSSGNVSAAYEQSFVIDLTSPEIHVRYATESASFVLESAEQDTITTTRDEAGAQVISVEDQSGNMHETTYRTSDVNGLHQFILDTDRMNGTIRSVNPSHYAISDPDTAGFRYEYLVSGGEEHRVVKDASGAVWCVDGDEVHVCAHTGPLQLITEHGRLKER